MNLRMILTAIVVAAVLPLMADTETVGDYTWTYRINGDESEILGSASGSCISPKPTGSVMVPTTLGGKLVTRIGDYSFSCCRDLTSVTIPEGVTSIGANAFSSCDRLRSVTIPDSVTDIGYRAFAGCDGSLYDMATVPGVQLVDGWVIGCMDSLQDLSLIDVRGIANSAFLDNGDLVSVTIGSSVKCIGAYAFERCSSLRNVTIASSVTNIGLRAFGYCDQLVGDGGFIIVQGVLFDSDSVRNIVSVHIPSGVNRIDGGAFAAGYHNASSVYIPGSVKIIGDGAFSACDNLCGVTMECGVEIIGRGAFSGAGLMGVRIPSSVTSIGSYAFEGRMCSFDVADSNPSYKVVSSGFLVSKDGKTLVHPGGNVHDYVTIPDGVINIREGVFSGCSELIGVTIPYGVKRIGNYAFCGCGFGDIAIPNSVSSIGEFAFKDCGLTSVMIPNGVTNIGKYAFTYCSHLSRVYLSKDYIGSTDVFRPSATIIRYNPNQTITLDANGGTVSPYNIIVAYGSVYGNLPNPSRPGYSFNGWTLDGEQVSSDTVVSALDDHCLVARWTKRCTVVFDANGGIGGTSAQMDCGSELISPNVSRIGFMFMGWSPEVPATVPDEDVTYTAQWKIIQYSVAFDANGGEGGTTGRYDYGEAIVAPTVTRIGYTFKGWTPEVLTTVPANDVTYTAQWQINRYTVTFNANGGASGTAEVEIEHGAMVGELPMPTRDKAVFLGWFTEAEGGEEVDASLTVADAVTLYAHWLTEVDNPVIASDAGNVFRLDSCVVTIACTTDGVAIYYTDDGTTPKKTADYLYTGPITITETTTFKAVAVIGDVQSEYVTVTITKQALTLEEALDVCDGVLIATGGVEPWQSMFDGGAKYGGELARSGAIGNRAETWLSATVEGAGALTFWCRTSCEHDEDNMFTWDRLMIYTNDVEIAEWRMDGETDWTERTLLFGGGVNTVKWVYYKDRTGADGEDCAWVDAVIWAPSAVAGSIPAVAVDADAAMVNAAVDDVGFADASAVKAAIGGSAEEYNAFKTWADGVKGATGDALAGEAAVVANAHAAAAYLLGAERLFENEPTVEIGELSIAEGESVGTTAMTVTVTVKDGESAVAVSAAKVAAMFEATGDLGDWTGAAKLMPTVTTSGTDTSGKMTFVVTPGDGTASKAFLRIKR